MAASITQKDSITFLSGSEQQKALAMTRLSDSLTAMVYQYYVSASNNYAATATFDFDKATESITHDDTNFTDNGQARSSVNRGICTINSSHWATIYHRIAVGHPTIAFTYSHASSTITREDTEVIGGSEYGYEADIELLDSTHLVSSVTPNATAGKINITEFDSSTYEMTYNSSSTTFTSSACRRNSIAVLSSSKFVVAWYNNSTNDGAVALCTVDGSYNVTVEDTYTFDIDRGNHPCAIKIDSDHFAIVYQSFDGSTNYPGVCRTFGVSGSNEISEIDSYEFDSYAAFTTIDRFGSTDYYALSYGTYTGSTYDAEVQVIEIDDSFNISTVATLNHWSGSGSGAYYEGVACLDDEYFMACFSDVNDNYKGYVRLFKFDSGETPAVVNNALFFGSNF